MGRSIAVAGLLLFASCAAPEGSDCPAGTCADAGAEESPGALAPGPDENPENDAEQKRTLAAMRRQGGGDVCLTNIAPEEIASTPREQRSLEELAIAMDGTPVADPARYERLVADVEALREIHPAGVFEYVPPFHGIVLELSPEAYEAAKAGAYTEWDCLNEAYGASVDLGYVSSGSDFRWVSLDFPGAFDLHEVIADYEELEGVEVGATNGLLGRSDNLCAKDTGEGIVYLSIEAWGDCPAGCIDERITGFLGTAPGELQPLGVWDSSDAAAGPKPAWAARPEGC